MVLFLWLECLPEQTEIKSADPDGRLAKLFDGLCGLKRLMLPVMPMVLFCGSDVCSGGQR